MEFLKKQDSEIYQLICAEDLRQSDSLRLIASENYISKAVLETIGTSLTNKYSEGYPGKRYYQGLENIDKIETLAIERAKKLFNAEHANVQPLSGASANLAIYLAFLKPHDRVLGMDLAHGGHLTHGAKVNFSGKLFDTHFYGVRPDTFCLDYDEIRKKAKEVQPKMIICGASSYPRTIRFDIFADIAKEVGAILLADIAHIAGLVATGLHPSPIPYADVVTSSTHKTLRGARGGLILCKKEYAAKIDHAVFPTTQGGTHNNLVAGKAVSFKEALSERFVDYSTNVIKNAQFLSESLKKYDFNILTGGTDNHIILIDLRNKNVRGLEIAVALNKAGIICNPNSIPFDPNKPFNPSGIRLGTPSVTSRGMKTEQMGEIASMIHRVVQDSKPESLKAVSCEVKSMCQKFPVHEYLSA